MKINLRILYKLSNTMISFRLIILYEYFIVFEKYLAGKFTTNKYKYKLKVQLN